MHVVGISLNLEGVDCLFGEVLGLLALKTSIQDVSSIYYEMGLKGVLFWVVEDGWSGGGGV